MATLSGTNNISADDINSNTIEFTNSLNNITPTVFNYLNGTTSNIQTQINTLSATNSTGSFTSVNGFNLYDTSSPNGFKGFNVYDINNNNYFNILENSTSGIFTRQLNLNSRLDVYSYNRSLYPTITLNQKVFQVYCDNGTGSTDSVNCYVKLNTSGGIISTALITGSAGLTISNGSSTFQNIINTTLTASGIITGLSGINITGTSTFQNIINTTLTSSGLISGSAGLNISSGNSTFQNIINTTLTSSGLISGSAGLNISSGSSSLQSLNCTTLTATSLSNLPTITSTTINTTNLTSNIINSSSYNSNTGFSFKDTSSPAGSSGFYLYDENNSAYLEFHENANSTITLGQLNINNTINIYSYNRSAFPTLTLNKQVFQIYCDGLNGTSDIVNCYVNFNSSGLITGSSGLVITGNTNLQSLISTSLNSPLITTSSINLYGGYIGLQPINGNYLQLFSLSGFTFNTNTSNGFIGSTETLRIDALLITINPKLNVNNLITGTSGITITGGTSTFQNIINTTLTSSGLITGNNGLTISNGTSTLQNVTTNNITSSGTINGQNANFYNITLNQILNLNDFVNGNNHYYGYIYNASGVIQYRSLNSLGYNNLTGHIFTTSDANNLEISCLNLTNGNITLYQPTYEIASFDTPYLKLYGNLPLTLNPSIASNTSSSTSSFSLSSLTQTTSPSLMIYSSFTIQSNSNQNINISIPVSNGGSFQFTNSDHYTTINVNNTMTNCKFIVSKDGTVWNSYTATNTNSASHLTSYFSTLTSTNFNYNQYIGNYSFSFVPSNQTNSSNYTISFSCSLTTTVSFSYTNGDFATDLSGYGIIYFNTLTSTHTSTIISGLGNVVFSPDATGYSVLNQSYNDNYGLPSGSIITNNINNINTITTKSVTLSNTNTIWSYPNVIGSQNMILLTTAISPITSATVYNCGSAIMSAGVYFLEGQLNFQVGAITQFSYSISFSSNSSQGDPLYQDSDVETPPSSATSYSKRISTMKQYSTITNLYFLAVFPYLNTIGSQISPNNTYLKITRIS